MEDNRAEYCLFNGVKKNSSSSMYRQGLESLQCDVVGEREVVHVAGGHHPVIVELHRAGVENGVLRVCYCEVWIWGMESVN